MGRMNNYYNDEEEPTEDVLISESMDNAYRIITQKDTYESLSIRKRGRVYVPFNPMRSGSEDIDELIDTMISYYASPDIEEYERCAELLKIKQSDVELILEDL